MWMTLTGEVLKLSPAIPQLKAVFQIGREETNSLSYSGMEVHSVEIQVQPCMCIKNLHPIPVDPNQSHTVRGPPNRH